MFSEKDLKRNNMFCEAGDRLKLMKAAECDWMGLLSEREITKVYVDHKECSVRRAEITDEEMRLIRKLEAEKNIVIYYMIQDECIGRCGTVPAYVINLEEQDYRSKNQTLATRIG